MSFCISSMVPPQCLQPPGFDVPSRRVTCRPLTTPSGLRAFDPIYSAWSPRPAGNTRRGAIRSGAKFAIAVVRAVIILAIAARNLAAPRCPDPI